MDKDLIYPLALSKLNESTLQIQWSNGISNDYNVRKLRFNCACAKCVNEWSGERMITLDSIPMNIKPKKIDSVGNYAIKIKWSDGHDSGIYSYRSLINDLAPLCAPKVCHEGDEHDS